MALTDKSLAVFWFFFVFFLGGGGGLLCPVFWAFIREEWKAKANRRSKQQKKTKQQTETGPQDANKKTT